MTSATGDWQGGRLYGSFRKLSTAWKYLRDGEGEEFPFEVYGGEAGAFKAAEDARLKYSLRTGKIKNQWRLAKYPGEEDGDDCLHVKTTRGDIFFIDPDESRVLDLCSWGILQNVHSPKHRYPSGNVKGTTTLLHRLLMNFPDIEVDHINGNTLDCRKKNLRIATRSDNMVNYIARLDTMTGVPGVHFLPLSQRGFQVDNFIQVDKDKRRMQNFNARSYDNSMRNAFNAACLFRWQLEDGNPKVTVRYPAGMQRPTVEEAWQAMCAKPELCVRLRDPTPRPILISRTGVKGVQFMRKGNGYTACVYIEGKTVTKQVKFEDYATQADALADLLAWKTKTRDERNKQQKRAVEPRAVEDERPRKRSKIEN